MPELQKVLLKPTVLVMTSQHCWCLFRDKHQNLKRLIKCQFLYQLTHNFPFCKSKEDFNRVFLQYIFNQMVHMNLSIDGHGWGLTSKRIQNWAAKTVLERGRRDSSLQALYELKWLPMEERIQFKILSIVCKCLIKEAPQYLQASYYMWNSLPDPQDKPPME